MLGLTLALVCGRWKMVYKALRESLGGVKGCLSGVVVSPVAAHKAQPTGKGWLGEPQSHTRKHRRGTAPLNPPRTKPARLRQVRNPAVRQVGAAPTARPARCFP